MEDQMGSLAGATNRPYTGIERRKRKPLFGMRLSEFDVDRSARHILTRRRTPADGVGLFVTPNIQHVAMVRHDPEFAEAMQRAQVAVCDGFPVYRYARFRGHALPGRITGREVVEHMLTMPDLLAGHRLFFLVDADDTATMIRAWVADHAPGVDSRTLVPPFGFDSDRGYCAELAEEIAAFDATILFLCIGAPKSELFVHRHRALLPPCWALCIGQSFKVALGMTARPPALMVRLNLEWLWRILLEPRRMLRRYVPSAVGFLAQVVADLRHR